MRSLFSSLLIAFSIAVSVAFVLDFFAYLPYGWKMPLAMIIAATGGLFLLILLIRSEKWSYLAAGSITALITFACIEVLFQFVLLEPLVPSTNAQFDSLIRESWPEDRSEARTDPSMFRIMGLADSFGRMGERKNYHYQIEDIAEEQGDHLEVVNLSKHGYQPEDEVLLLTRFGERYNPDIVVHGVFVGNDLANPDGIYATYQGIYVRRRPGFNAFRPIFFTSSQWTRKALRVIQERKRMEVDTAGGLFSEETFLEVQLERTRFFRPGEDAKWGPIIDILDEIVEETQRMGATYVMVVHPDQVQVHKDMPGKIENQFGVDLSGHNFNLPQEFLRQFCEERGLHFVDLLPTFKSMGQDGGYYLLNDAHYNDDGNALAAQTIYEYLKAEQLIP